MSFNPNIISTTNMKDIVKDFSVGLKMTEGPTGQKRYEWMNPRASQQRGYYRSIPELKRTIDLFATITIGQGFDADPETQIILDHISGRGNQSFEEILWAMLIMTKIYGDAFAEIIRDEETGTLLNLKILDNGTIKIIANTKGIIEGYEQTSKIPEEKGKILQEFKPNEIFHLSNDMVDDEIHGISVIDACEWVILARNEAMVDVRRTLHRSTLRVMEIDTDDKTARDNIKKQYGEAILGELLLVPKGSVGFPDVPPMPIAEHQTWIRYLENFFYQAVGIPKVMTGGSEEFTEASSKIAFTSHDQQSSWDGNKIANDIWNQLFLRVKFRKPVSIQNELITDTRKDSGQLNPMMENSATG